jgi:hypothetical protein
MTSHMHFTYDDKERECPQYVGKKFHLDLNNHQKKKIFVANFVYESFKTHSLRFNTHMYEIIFSYVNLPPFCCICSQHL